MDKQDILSKINNNTVLFFDLDGTLVDTDYANFLSYKYAIQSVVGTHIFLAYEPNNRFNRSILKTKFPYFDSDILAKIISAKESIYLDFLPKTQIITQTTDILLKYAETNKTVLVSNCRTNRVSEILNYHKITNKFSNIFSRQISTNEAHFNKYSNAIHKLSVLPENIIVFENEKSEIVDAIKAGVPTYNIIEFHNF
jgi:beta-phosphoglucomutase-like phosphatase (HAD superfamily)